MNLGDVFDAALAAQEVCRAIGLPYCVIGGLAVQRWGEPRYTADVDLCVLVEQGEEANVARALLDRLPARIDDAPGFAARTRVVLLRSERDIGIDVVLAGLPFEARVIQRASLWKLDEEHSLRTCSAEDLLVMKVFAGRDKDWADVTSILERQSIKLNLDLVREELHPLLVAKEALHLAEEFERRVRRHAGV